MSQAEALATRAWCGSGRNGAIEYFWGRKQRAVQRFKPKCVGRTAKSTSDTKCSNHRRGTVEQVVGGGATKKQWVAEWTLFPALPSHDFRQVSYSTTLDFFSCERKRLAK